MKVPRKYREDKVYLKLSEITLDDWQSLSGTTKQKRWYEAARYGDDNPLLAIGITERQMKDDYNEYARNLRRRNKEPIVPQKPKRIIRDSEPISEEHTQIILQLRTEIEMKEEMVRRIRESLEDKDATIEKIRKELAQEKREREIEIARERQDRISQNERLRREHACEIERLRQEYSSEISHLKDEIINLTTELSEQKRVSDEKITSLTTELTEQKLITEELSKHRLITDRLINSFSEQLVPVQRDLRFVIDNLVGSQDQMKSMLNALNLRLDGIQLTRSSSS